MAKSRKKELYGMEQRIAFYGLPGSQAQNMVAQSGYAFSVAFLPYR